jgi:hypothetical protein
MCSRRLNETLLESNSANLLIDSDENVIVVKRFILKGELAYFRIFVVVVVVVVMFCFVISLLSDKCMLMSTGSVSFFDLFLVFHVIFTSTMSVENSVESFIRRHINTAVERGSSNRANRQRNIFMVSVK